MPPELPYLPATDIGGHMDTIAFVGGWGKDNDSFQWTHPPTPRRIMQPVPADPEVLLLDGHTLEGKVLDVTADGFKLESHPESGGTVVVSIRADHVDPHWWYEKRDAALGDDAKQRLELSVWAVEHGLFRRAKAQFEKARKLDPKTAREFQDQVIPGLRAGIAGDLVHSAKLAMDAGRLDVANKMLQAVLTRFGDTHAAADARELQPTLQHRMDAHLKHLAHWKKSAADARASEQADQRRRITDPIVALIRQGNNIMGHMPPMAAQADSAAHVRQAAIEYKKALEKIDQALKAHADDKELVQRLESLKKQAQGGVVQGHVTAGDVYAATGNYTDAAAEANELEAIDPDSSEARALRSRINESKSWDEDGIVSTRRWAGRRAGAGGGRRR